MTTPTTIKLRRIGNSIGATFPKEALDRLGLEEKSEMHLLVTGDGFVLKRHDADFEEAMTLYKETAARYRNALRELAK